jgi:hypothetical protein
MRRILIVIGVLGSGTALSFAAAGAILLASPEGRLVANTYQGGGPIQVLKGGGPIPMPLPVQQGVVVDDVGVGVVPPATRILRVDSMPAVKAPAIAGGTDPTQESAAP